MGKLWGNCGVWVAEICHWTAFIRIQRTLVNRTIPLLPFNSDLMGQKPCVARLSRLSLEIVKLFTIAIGQKPHLRRHHAYCTAVASPRLVRSVDRQGDVVCDSSVRASRQRALVVSDFVRVLRTDTFPVALRREVGIQIVARSRTTAAQS